MKGARGLITAKQIEELTAEFSELSSPDVVLPKEVYAHFGLLFFKFSLIEHGLINALTFHHAGMEFAAQKIRNKQEWEAAYDTGYVMAKQKTFGNLVRAVLFITEFTPFADRLARIKTHRDYFAHHFFREEVGIYQNSEGCWHVLWVIKQLRDQLIAMDDQLSSPIRQMCTRLKVPLPSVEALRRSERELIDAAGLRLTTGDPFPWAKSPK